MKYLLAALLVLPAVMAASNYCIVLSGGNVCFNASQTTGLRLNASDINNLELAESDPQVNAVTNNLWCRGTGTQVTCDETPITNTNQLVNGAGFLTSYTETDPTIVNKVSDKYCVYNSTSSKIECDRTAGTSYPGITDNGSLVTIGYTTNAPGLLVGNGSVGFFGVGGSYVYDNGGALTLNSDTSSIVAVDDIRIDGNDIIDSTSTSRISLGSTTSINGFARVNSNGNTLNLGDTSNTNVSMDFNQRGFSGYDGSAGTMYVASGTSKDLVFGINATTSDPDGTNVFMFKRDSGNIGIGTTTPTSPITWSGDNDNPLRFVTTDSSWSYLSWYWSATRKAYLGVNAVGNFELGDADLNVLKSTTIAGNFTLSNVASGTRMNIVGYNIASTGTQANYPFSAGIIAIGHDANFGYIQSFGSRPINFNPAGNNVVFGNSATKVGINTTSPTTALSVTGVVNITGNIYHSSGTTRQFANGCLEIANTTGVYFTC